MSSIDAILELAKLGFRVHPLLPRNKVPIIGKWQERATTVESVIRLWYTQYKDCNWGIATGKDSGIIVIDVDPKNGGNETWQKLVGENGDVNTVSVKTGSGGTHYYFAYPQGLDIGNSPGNLGRGIDVRGNDGQVVAPGSVHPNGTVYEWQKCPTDCHLQELPQWLLDRITDVGDNTYDKLGGKIERGNTNNSIYHVALSLARQGTTLEFALSAIKNWVMENGHGNTPESEIAATVESAYKFANRKQLDISERSDTFNAELLIDNYGTDLIYVPGLGWYHWDGKVWKPDPESAIVTQLFIQCMRSLREEATQKMAASSDRNEIKDLSAIMNWSIRSMSAGAIAAAVSLATTFPSVRRDPTAIDLLSSLWLLNCNNGTVDLKTGKINPHRKEDMITKMVPVDYVPDAQCPFWKSTFELVFPDNPNLITFMQRALGYSITGSVDERCFFICWGESGANGKSTILETVQDLLGPGYAQMSDMVVITSSTMDNRVSSSLGKLQGARFVSMNEAEENQKLSEALVKQLTGGDTIEAKFLYKNPFEYKPVFKLWVRTNEKPIIRSQTNSIWDRIKLIPFEHSIPKDKRKPRSEIDAIFLSEQQGILAWLVEGARMWLENNSLGDPAEISAAVQGYRTDSDIVRLFVEECVEEGSKHKMKAADAYQAFAGWMKDSGERYIMTRTKFTQRCAALTGNPTSRSGGHTYINGMKLNSQASLYVA